MTVIHLHNTGEYIPDQLLNTGQRRFNRTKGFLQGRSNQIRIVHKWARKQIQDIRCKGSAKLCNPHKSSRKNPDQIRCNLFCAITAECTENSCQCLREVSRNLSHLGSDVKHGHQVVCNPAAVLCQISVNTAQQVIRQGGPDGSHRAGNLAHTVGNGNRQLICGLYYRRIYKNASQTAFNPLDRLFNAVEYRRIAKTRRKSFLKDPGQLFHLCQDTIQYHIGFPCLFRQGPHVELICAVPSASTASGSARPGIRSLVNDI